MICAAAHIILGQVFTQRQQQGEAIAAFRKVLAINPQDLMALTLLGQSYMDLTDYARAEEIYRHALDLGLEQADIYYSLGLIQEHKGMLAAARNHFERAMQLDLEHASACHRLGAVLENLGEEARALRQYGKTLKLDPEYAAACHSMARLLLKKGNTEQGREWMQIFQRLKQYEETVKARKLAVQREPRNMDAAYQLGLVYFEHRRFEKARGVLARILQLDPGYAAAREKLEQISKQFGP